MLAIKKHPVYASLFVLSDILAITASFFAAYHFRFSEILIPALKGIPTFEIYFRTMAFVIPIYLIIFKSYRLYEPKRYIRRIHELITVVKAVTIAAFIMMAITFVYREFSYSRAVLLFVWIFSILFCCGGRYLLIQFEYMIRSRYGERVLIIGANRSARDLIRWARGNPHYGQDIFGIISEEETNQGKHFEGVPILGTLSNFEEMLDQNVDEVILADPSISREVATNLMIKCENKMIRFKVAADFYGLLTHYVDVEYISSVPLLGLKSLPLDDIFNRIIKRTFDLTISALGLLLLSSLFLILAVVIKMVDRGPVFYRQERVGRDQKHFILYKFRTMIPDAEQKTGPVWAKSTDERTTKIGKFLRRTNLDELPQLWNVFVGDMSLVGPRPERPHFVEQFKNQIPRYMSRHKIKSGLTGWAQIHGFRGNTSLEERIKYDLYYMENWTLMMDVEILFATIFAFKNAY